MSYPTFLSKYYSSDFLAFVLIEVGRQAYIRFFVGISIVYFQKLNQREPYGACGILFLKKYMMKTLSQHSIKQLDINELR